MKSRDAKSKRNQRLIETNHSYDEKAHSAGLVETGHNLGFNRPFGRIRLGAGPETPVGGLGDQRLPA